MALLRGTFLAVLYMRFFGADVASSAYANCANFYEPPLLTIGPDAIIDEHGINLAHVYEHGNLFFRRKTIGKGVVLHPVSITWAGDVVPDGVILGPRGQFGKGASRHVVPPGTVLQGCPARDYTGLYRAALQNDGPSSMGKEEEKSSTGAP